MAGRGQGQRTYFLLLRTRCRVSLGDLRGPAKGPALTAVLPRTPRAPFAWPCSLPLRPWYHRSFIPPACSAGSLPHAHTTVNVPLKRASLTQMKELKLYSSSMEAGVNLHDLGEGRWLCSYDNKSTVGRQNVNFCTSKGTTRKVKTPFTDCKKIFENHISEIYFKNLPLQH